MHNTATTVIKILVLYHSCQTKCIIYQANIHCEIAGYKQNFTLAPVKQHLKIVSEIIKSLSTTLNTKIIRNYQKNFGKSKSEIEHQKLLIKMIRICRFCNPNSKRCLLCLNEKYEIATYKGDNLLNKITEIINTCRHRSKYKLANCDTIAMPRFKL